MWGIRAWPGRASAAVAMATALIMAGCSSSTVDPTSLDEAGSAHWQMVLANARSGGANQAQNEAIERAVETGSMSLQTLNQLVDETFSCFDDAGIPYEIASPDVIAPGIELRRYTFSVAPGLSEDQSLALADACIDGYSHFAESGFRAQPTTQQSVDAALEDDIPVAIACLREHDVDIQDDATIDEVRIASREFITQLIRDGEDLIICWPEHEPE